MEEEYNGQICQDDKINESFRKLHQELVNRIIEWCNRYGVDVDEVTLNADGLGESIRWGHWVPSTDSYFILEKDSKNYIVSA